MNSNTPQHVGLLTAAFLSLDSVQSAALHAVAHEDSELSPGVYAGDAVVLARSNVTVVDEDVEALNKK